MTTIEKELALEMAQEIESLYKAYEAKCAELVRHLKVCEGTELTEGVGYSSEEGIVLVKPNGYLPLEITAFIEACDRRLFKTQRT